MKRKASGEANIVQVWLSVDPLAEEFPDVSPYCYTLNNPINLIDPDGRAPEEIDPPGKKKATTSTIRNYDSSRMQTGYPGQALDELVTAGIQWLGSQLSGSDVSKRTSENFQLATSLAIVIVSKGKNAKADGEVVEQLTKAEGKTYQTYIKEHPTEAPYSGKTSGTGTPRENIAKRDGNHHMNEKGYGPAKLDKSSSSSDAIRGREQQNIMNNGGAKSQGGTSGNAINGVSPKNPKAAQYQAAAKKEFGN